MADADDHIARIMLALGELDHDRINAHAEAAKQKRRADIALAAFDRLDDVVTKHYTVDRFDGTWSVQEIDMMEAIWDALNQGRAEISRG